MEGNFGMKFQKERLHTRENNQGEHVKGCHSVFGDIARCLSHTSFLQHQEFNLMETLDFPQTDINNQNRSQATVGRGQLLRPEDGGCLNEPDIWRELDFFKRGFSDLISCVAELLGEDFFAHLRARQDDLDLRSRPA